jgi:hypothetical protein
MARIWKEKTDYIFSDSELVDVWIDMHQESWFKNKESIVFDCEDQARDIAEYWLRNYKHKEDNNDTRIIYFQTRWNAFINNYEEA